MTDTEPVTPPSSPVRGPGVESPGSDGGFSSFSEGPAKPLEGHVIKVQPRSGAVGLGGIPVLDLWSSPLREPCDDSGIGVAVCLSPCVAHGKSVRRLSHSTGKAVACGTVHCICCAPSIILAMGGCPVNTAFLLSGLQRRNLRRAFGLPGVCCDSVFDDLCVHLLCWPCAMAQEQHYLAYVLKL